MLETKAEPRKVGWYNDNDSFFTKAQHAAHHAAFLSRGKLYSGVAPRKAAIAAYTVVPAKVKNLVQFRDRMQAITAKLIIRATHKYAGGYEAICWRGLGGITETGYSEEQLCRAVGTEANTQLNPHGYYAIVELMLHPGREDKPNDKLNTKLVLQLRILKM